MRGTFKINGKDTYTTWGVILAEGSMDQLLAIPPMKDPIFNESSLEDGRRVLLPSTPKKGSRDLQLEVHLLAVDETQFFQRYAAFGQELMGGEVDIKTDHSDDVYHCVYRSCTTFSDFNGRVAKMSLKLTEYNPGFRG